MVYCMIPAVEKPKKPTKKTILLNPGNDIFRNAFIDKHMEYVTIIYFLQQKKE